MRGRKQLRIQPERLSPSHIVTHSFSSLFQRQDYKVFKQGRPSRLTQEKIDTLNGIQFVWEAQRGGKRRKLRPLDEGQGTATRVAPEDASSRQESKEDPSQASLPNHFSLAGASLTRHNAPTASSHSSQTLSDALYSAGLSQQQQCLLQARITGGRSAIGSSNSNQSLIQAGLSPQQHDLLQARLADLRSSLGSSNLDASVAGALLQAGRAGSTTMEDPHRQMLRGSLQSGLPMLSPASVSTPAAVPVATASLPQRSSSAESVLLQIRRQQQEAQSPASAGPMVTNLQRRTSPTESVLLRLRQQQQEGQSQASATPLATNLQRRTSSADSLLLRLHQQHQEAQARASLASFVAVGRPEPTSDYSLAATSPLSSRSAILASFANTNASPLTSRAMLPASFRQGSTPSRVYDALQARSNPGSVVRSLAAQLPSTFSLLPAAAAEERPVTIDELLACRRYQAGMSNAEKSSSESRKRARLN